LKIKGIILKQALQKLGIKQEEAAAKLGVSRPTLSVWCNKDELTEDIVHAIKQKLDIDLTIDGPGAPVDDNLMRLIKSYEAKEELYQRLLTEKDETIKALKDHIEYLKLRLAQYEDKPKTGTH